MAEPAYVVTVTPTIMSGTVVRWFPDLEAAERFRPIISASRYAVITHVEGVVTADLLAQVEAAHAALESDDEASVKPLQTHRRSSLVGPFVVVAEPDPGPPS